MQHRTESRKAEKYIRAFSWRADIDSFVRAQIKEKPLLHVCSGPVSSFGNIRMDRYVKPIPPAVIGDWTNLPFQDNSFGAVFADPPWNIGYMKACADFCKEALRVAPVAYVMSPWLWCKKGVARSIWLREFPGVNQPILFVRYVRMS